MEGRDLPKRFLGRHVLGESWSVAKLGAIARSRPKHAPFAHPLRRDWGGGSQGPTRGPSTGIGAKKRAFPYLSSQGKARGITGRRRRSFPSLAARLGGRHRS